MGNTNFKRKIDKYTAEDGVLSKINQVKGIEDFRIHCNKTSKDLLKIDLKDEEIETDKNGLKLKVFKEPEFNL